MTNKPRESVDERAKKVQVFKDENDTYKSICGDEHSEEALYLCDLCMAIHKSVLKKKEEAIEKMHSLMGKTQLEYKDKIEKELANG
jgi:hypothetical protein